jgi:hypothetical protein
VERPMIFGARIPAAPGPPISHQAKRSAERAHLQRIQTEYDSSTAAWADALLS